VACNTFPQGTRRGGGSEGGRRPNSGASTAEPNAVGAMDRRGVGGNHPLAALLEKSTTCCQSWQGRCPCSCCCSCAAIAAAAAASAAAFTVGETPPVNACSTRHDHHAGHTAVRGVSSCCIPFGTMHAEHPPSQVNRWPAFTHHDATRMYCAWWVLRLSPYMGCGQVFFPAALGAERAFHHVQL
jgi:hypothetical protein